MDTIIWDIKSSTAAEGGEPQRRPRGVTWLKLRNSRNIEPRSIVFSFTDVTFEALLPFTDIFDENYLLLVVFIGASISRFETRIYSRRTQAGCTDQWRMFSFGLEARGDGPAGMRRMNSIRRRWFKSRAEARSERQGICHRTAGES
jgi:hypothetical protein